MIVKELIEKWRSEMQTVKGQIEKVGESAVTLKHDVIDLKNQIAVMVKVNQEMAEAMQMLIRQQLGD